MVKSIIKEAGIVILILIAVILVLTVIFYEYIPNNKTVPIKLEAYTIPENIKQELQVSTEEQNIVRYYIDSTDLDLYESTNDYDKGKANPFADYSETATQNTTNNTNNESSSNKNNTENKTENNNSVANNSSDNDDANGSDKKEVFINTPGKNY